MPGPPKLPPEDKKTPTTFRLSHDARRKISKMVDAKAATNNTDAVETALEDYEIEP